MSQLIVSHPVLLIGAHGLLGSEIASALEEQKISVLKKTSSELDITDTNAVTDAINKIKPHWIINAAAYTDVDKAETERESARLINAIGPSHLAHIAASVNARLIHFSTDYVFSGEGEKPWTETDLREPVTRNWYGETKLMGEKEVLNYPNHLVIRVQWLYGKKRNRFAGLRNRESFSPFVDQFGAPTWTQDIVKVLLALMAQEVAGLFHFAYDDFASWMDVYQVVKDEWKLPVKLFPAHTRNADLPAQRPLNGRLSNEKLKKQLGVQSLGSWKTSLKEFLHQVQND
jgi:dTDP-4-dehydrorhamnose reductase